ncbi:flagellin [uncultured Marinobacter sp.]|uniref:flagellin N-terminal helical domain-containing protein n=1 Tax=uncultured Marinobacter sp. TaxID=187379 RepID=UPI0030C82B3E
MPQVINTNIASLNAQRNLNASQGQANVALERLSSGLRINSAKDDAAGLAISERFQSQITGLNQAQRNANDGISLSQTAEGAMDEITNNLQRIRELAVQSANATNSISDRQALNQEVQQRIEEINRIAAQTSFNGLKVLDGTFSTQTFQVGANAGETIAISGLDSRGSQIGSVLNRTTSLGATVVGEDIGAGQLTTDDLTLKYSDGDIAGILTIGDTDVVINSTAPANISALAGDIQTAINNNPDLDGTAITVGTDGNALTFSSTLLDDQDFELNLSNQGATATTVDETDFAGSLAGADNTLEDGSSATVDLTGFIASSFSEGSITVDGVAIPFTSEFDSVEYDDLNGLASAITSTLQSNGIDLTASMSGSTLQLVNSGSGSNYTVSAFSLDDNADLFDFSQSTEIPGEVGTTLRDYLDEGNPVDFSVVINAGTPEELTIEVPNATSLNDIVSKVNARTNDTGIQANLDSDNGDIYFSTQFGESFTVDLTADIDGSGVLTDARDINVSVVGDPAANSVSMVDIDISTTEGSELALLAVDYAIESINGFRAELGAVQNRFESTIANLATTSENLSASNSRIRDADFAAESAELARTQVLQQAGLSVLAQANARPQQVLQLLQG